MLSKEKQANAMNLILNLRGRMFGATFIKKDGTVRSGTFMADYHWQSTTGNPKRGRTYAREMHGLIKAVDMGIARERGKAAAIRSIPLARLIRLDIDGRTLLESDL